MTEINGHDQRVKPARVLTILGCGTLGSAILFGLLADSNLGHLQNGAFPGMLNGGHQNGLTSNGDTDRPTQFIACVRTERSATRLKQELASLFHHPVPVKICQGDNVLAVQAASTILLGCQPKDLTDCLTESGLVRALQGKLVISILAGITIPQIESLIPRPSPSEYGTATSIIRAMPNTCALNKSSTTLLTASVTDDHQRALDSMNYAKALFSSIGTVHVVAPADMDACTALCGSTPAFFALILEGLLDGAVALGLKRSEARVLIAETMKGVADGVAKGGGTGEVIEKVCTPGGSSIQGLLVLERGGSRGLLADALSASAGANKTFKTSSGR